MFLLREFFNDSLVYRVSVRRKYIDISAPKCVTRTIKRYTRTSHIYVNKRELSNFMRTNMGTSKPNWISAPVLLNHRHIYIGISRIRYGSNELERSARNYQAMPPV